MQSVSNDNTKILISKSDLEMIKTECFNEGVKKGLEKAKEEQLKTKKTEEKIVSEQPPKKQKNKAKINNEELRTNIVLEEENDNNA